MTGWHLHLGPMLAFDTETTGVDVFEDRIVTATTALITSGSPPQIRAWLLNPGIDIPEGATKIHGITTEKARAEGVEPKPALIDIAGELYKAWANGTPVVAFNASYDLSILKAELFRHGQHSVRLEGPVIDPYVIDKHLDPYRKGKRTLTATAAHYGVRLDGAHDATEDALAAARVAWRIAQNNPDIAGMPLDALHAAQVVWAAEQAASFRKYREKRGEDTTGIDGAWPIRTRQETP